jgi:hypothetical protein
MGKRKKPESTGGDSDVLKINNVEPKEKWSHPDPIHPVFPKHAFSMLIVAPKGSGKTNLLVHLILHQYKKYFHDLIVCSPTIANDPKWSLVKRTSGILVQNRKLEEILEGRSRNRKKWKLVFANPGDEKKEVHKFDGRVDPDKMFGEQNKLWPILEQQQMIIEYLNDTGYEDEAKYIADRLLIIIDDCAGTFKNTNNNPMVNYVIKHRHYSSSPIIVTQALKAIPKTIRTNCNAHIYFDIGNNQELKAIYEETCDGLPEDIWLAMYKHAVKSEPYSFLYFNNMFPPGKRFYKRFESLLTPQYSIEEASTPLVKDGAESDSDSDSDSE